ncbi:EamA family transporter [Sphingomonas oleivorans]|uniref:EamA family transporter n=1 Tax=Sphingomonas oleivorans TaxID=1735121 RepID=A0A2T5FTH8_9SPHN|nr:DMT family transporter [Sphingomonas oleivorans]PTQ07369.1 EamA family transporter [Sphingomonas oleivorans]
MSPRTELQAPKPQVRPSGLGPRDLFVAIVMNICWGLNIVAVKMAVVAAGPFTAGWLRQIVVLVICLPFLRLVPGRMGTLLLVGLINGALWLAANNLSLLVSTNVSALAIASQLGVPFSLILAVLFLKERIALTRTLGIAFTFAGVALLVFDPLVAREIPGLLLTALAAIFWAIGSLLLRRLAGVPVLTIYAWIGLIGGLLLAPLTIWIEPARVAALPDLRLGDFSWILFSAIGSTLVGHGGMAWLLQRHPMETVMPLTLASPIVAVIASSLMFGTVLTPVMIAGGVMAMTGVAIITFRTVRKGGGRTRPA